MQGSMGQKIHGANHLAIDQYGEAHAGFDSGPKCCTGSAGAGQVSQIGSEKQISLLGSPTNESFPISETGGARRLLEIRANGPRFQMKSKTIRLGISGPIRSINPAESRS